MQQLFQLQLLLCVVRIGVITVCPPGEQLVMAKVYTGSCYDVLRVVVIGTLVHSTCAYVAGRGAYAYTYTRDGAVSCLL